MTGVLLPGWAISLLLGITQTIGYGTLYYAFGMLVPHMATDTGHSMSWIYGLFSAALVLSGLIATRAGALMDRQNPALVMAGGSALCALLLAGWAFVPGNVAFGIFLIATQLASVLVLYEAAFVTVAHVAGEDQSRRVITGITFVAGFASTVFWPLTQWMLGFADWRLITAAYGGLHLVVCLPMHLFLGRCRAHESGRADENEETRSLAQPRRAIGDPALRRMMFWLLLVGFAANSFVISAVHLHLIGILGGLGLGASAAMIGATIGPSQVAARVLEYASAQRTSIHVPSIISGAALPLALMLLLAGAPAVGFALAFAVIFGIGQGLAFIVRGVLPLEVFGRKGYGALMGQINASRLIVSAAAPFVIALAMDWRGVEFSIFVLSGAGTISALALMVVAWMTRR